MTVYADVLVLVNLYLDFFLLRCVKKFLDLRVKNRRLVLGALTGAALSLTALLPQELPALSLLLGAATALAVTAAAFAPVKPRMFCRAAVCFWAFSLLLAGFFLFLLRFFAPSRVAVLGSVVYFDLSLPLLFVFTCGAYAVFRLLRRLLPAPNSGPVCRWLAVEHRGKRARVYAKEDTGSALREPFSGLPVLVCQADSLGETAPAEVLAFLRDGTAETGDGLRLVPFDTLGGAGVLPAFLPEKVTDEKTGTPLRCCVALSAKKLSAGQFDALYGPELFPPTNSSGGNSHGKTR